MAQGAFALLALVPLALARARRGSAAARRGRCRTGRSGRAVPQRRRRRGRRTAASLPYVEEVVLVDDGTPEEEAAVLAAIGEWPGVRLVRLAANAGKGDAVAAGAAVLLARPEPAGRADRGGRGRPAPARPDSGLRGRGRPRDVVIGDRRGDRARCRGRAAARTRSRARS